MHCTVRYPQARSLPPVGATGAVRVIHMIAAGVLAVSALVAGPLAQSTPPADATPADVAIDAFGEAMEAAGFETSGTTNAENLATDEVFQPCLGTIDEILLADPTDPDDPATNEFGLTAVVVSDEFELVGPDGATTDPVEPTGEEFAFAVAWTVDDDHVGELEDAAQYFGTQEAEDCVSDALTASMVDSFPEGSVPDPLPFTIDVSATDLEVGDHSSSLGLDLEVIEDGDATLITFEVAQAGNVGVLVVRGAFNNANPDVVPTDGGNALEAMVDAVS
ncbi:hypothetical protein BH24ACT5_BH24ACT5_01240 [soil metagenome]